VALGLCLAGALLGCHKEEQAVVGVAQTAVTAEQKAQAAAQVAAAESDRQRTQLDRIPLPTKSLYIDVKDASAWANPFLSVDAETMSLRITSDSGSNRHQEATLHPADLAQAVLALPPSAWRYGRVIAVAESPHTAVKDRPKARRNVEAVVKQLNDMGIVVEDWQTR